MKFINKQFAEFKSIFVSEDLLKENDNTKIINCSLEVYEVFEMTGFSEMMEISKSYREISLKGCKKIGEGFYGMFTGLMLKLL